MLEIQETPSHELRLINGECFVGAADGMQLRRMVATVPASELKKVCESVGVPTLFSLNPRSSLGTRSAVSKKIKKTIEVEPARLWHYNNGISAICERFEYDMEAGIVWIDNLKVVNGCQTITTIANMDDVDPSAGLVIRLSESKDVEFIESISRCTNDQSVIKSSDMQSNHPYLKKLEGRFKIYDKFFFERKRGLWMTWNERPKTRQPLYLIKNVDGARLKLAYTGSPHLSMQLSTSKIFKFDEKDPDKSQPFIDLYKDADPKDFIVPNVLDHLLGRIKKRIRNSVAANTIDLKNARFLLRYKIGHYYSHGHN